jgi:prolipoprotein diacylglyceryltransferase
MPIHLLFDLLAYAVGTLLVVKVFKNRTQLIENENLRYAYYTTLIMGAFFGAFLLGSINTYISLEVKDSFIVGKSILGAIVGATLTGELFKKIMHIKGSTGAYFVPSLVIGIAIGRVGCFLSGLEDYTYGTPTHFFLGYDFGDGIPRHPVQLYESFTMALFFIYLLFVYLKKRVYFEKHIFYQFILLYATQRFAWEFLKPYETLFMGLNVFQFFCLGLVGYALYYLRRTS